MTASVTIHFHCKLCKQRNEGVVDCHSLTSLFLFHIRIKKTCWILEQIEGD